MTFFDYLPRMRYSSDLHQQLKGYSPDCTGYHGDPVYLLTAILVLVLGFLILLNYYYGLFNQPRFTRRRVWLLHVLVTCCITGFFSYVWSAAHLPKRKHCEELHFTAADCFLYVITVMLYTALVCLLWSLILKWKSIANKKIPF